jgi:hypothetical protein
MLRQALVIIAFSPRKEEGSPQGQARCHSGGTPRASHSGVMSRVKGRTRRLHAAACLVTSMSLGGLLCRQAKEEEAQPDSATRSLLEERALI